MKKWNTQELTAFIQEFESGTLPREQWTHEAHLIVAFWYLFHLPRTEAIRKISRKIIDYNQACGVANTDTSGYHETLTLFWIEIVVRFMARQSAVLGPDQLINRLLSQPYVTSSLPLNYYSREKLFSVEARKRWVEPDLKLFNDL